MGIALRFVRPGPVPSLLVAVAILGVALGPSSSHAQTAAAQVTVVTESFTTPDPGSITWEVQISGAPVTEAVLMYTRLNPDGNLGGEIRAELPTRGMGVITAELTTNGPRAYIPVGSEFIYHWVFTAEDGSTVETEPVEFTFLDGRFNWGLLDDRGVRVHWYADEGLARSVLDASAEAIAELSAMLGRDVDFPVTMVLYGGGQDGLLAQRPRGGVYDQQAITGGTRVAPHIVHVYSGLGLTFEDIARHEVAHIVVKQAGEGPFAQVPSWLDEGIATYAQVNKGGRLSATEFAIQSDTTMRLRNMVAATNRAELIDLFYGQSWFTVEYMLDEYGPDGMAALMASIRSGNRIDDALLEVYGVDQDGLYNEWRVSVGLAPVEFAATDGGSRTVQPDATRAPLTLPTSITGITGSTGAPAGGAGSSGVAGGPTDGPADADAAASSGSGNATTAAIIAVVTIALAALLGGLGYRLMRGGQPRSG